MRIPEEYIKKFQELYKKEFGEDISSEEAQVQCLALVRLVAIKKEGEMLEGRGEDVAS
ncbi:hypothetical protein FWH09_00135 [Candidatus Saccharibacteria bacterium]|nr:hypothetical protein [Candidatus Saccharibacteria bacterium]